MSTIKTASFNIGPYLRLCFCDYIFDATFPTRFLNYTSQVPNQKSDMCLFARIQKNSERLSRSKIFRIAGMEKKF